MKSNKGQALIEFILILPFIILLILGFIDISKVVLTKFELQRELDTVVSLYEGNDIDNYDGGFEVEYLIDGKYTTIIVKKEITINTPILKDIIEDELEESVVILNE